MDARDGVPSQLFKTLSGMRKIINNGNRLERGSVGRDRTQKL
jgi:hypothetical protein